MPDKIACRRGGFLASVAALLPGLFERCRFVLPVAAPVRPEPRQWMPCQRGVAAARHDTATRNAMQRTGDDP